MLRDKDSGTERCVRDIDSKTQRCWGTVQGGSSTETNIDQNYEIFYELHAVQYTPKLTLNKQLTVLSLFKI